MLATLRRVNDEAHYRLGFTVKIQVNRMVSWIWLGGVVLTLGTLLSLLPERRMRANGAGAPRGRRTR